MSSKQQELLKRALLSGRRRNIKSLGRSTG